VLAHDQALAGAPPAEPALEAPRSAILRLIWEREWAVVLLLAAWAAFLFFWRLDVPGKYIYDEVYHAYTGNLMVQNDPKVYEWWQSAPQQPIEGVQYEWTHPPLGKLIIGGSIWLFGNNSLGWRFGNALFGVICVVLLYVLAAQLFRDRLLATLATGLITVEGLMFAESRIGTNDIFQLAFLLAAYSCFAVFLRRPARFGIGWLLATGLFLGLGFATKWPSLYSIVLLAAIALLRGVWRDGWTDALTRRARAAARPAEEPAGDRSEEPAAAPTVLVPAPFTDASLGQVALQPLRLARAGPAWGFFGRLGYLIAAFFATVVAPCAIYVASYTQMFLQEHHIPPGYAGIGPFKLGPFSTGERTLPDSSWWDMFVGEQWQMWHYHTTLTAGHPYYSKWWQWLLDIRPVFYYVDRSSEGWVANTYNLGNPLLYWGFPIAIVLGAWLIWRRRDLKLALVLAAFLINWLPWTLSPRGLFFYHFLPSVPFLVLMVAYCLAWLWRQPDRKWQQVAATYVGVVFVCFAFFYTQLAAVTVPEWFADLHYWLPSWQ
jgi:dolichyl-phosphate-mannose-protein mannosyltransferase